MSFKRPTNGIFYIQDVCQEAGIKKETLIRMEACGKIPQAARDRNNWRVYTRDEMDGIVAVVRAVRRPEDSGPDQPAGEVKGR